MEIVIRVDAPDAFIPAIIEELLKKFPVTILEVKEEDAQYKKTPSTERVVI